MAKKFSFIADNVTPLSQNNRSTALLDRLRNDLTIAHNLKYTTKQLPKNPLINDEYLQAKVFYIHRVPDFKDADNISKPLWDSLNKHAYIDDKQIKYIETLKVDINRTDLIEFNTENMDDQDYSKLLAFVLDTNNTLERILYINISDYESKNIRF
jgi:Holliday junction resolvase RusA-like endonuclease